MKCPHIKNCKQEIVHGSFLRCTGKNSFPHDYDKCYQWHSLDAQGKYHNTTLKRAEEWQRVTAKP